MTYTRDGGVIPSHIPIMSEAEMSKDRSSMYGVYRGYVQKPVFPEDSENTSGELEYVVNVKGQNFLGVIDGQAKAGGILSNHRRVRTGVEAIDPADVSRAKHQNAVPNDLKDGEAVWVLFVEGQLDFPIIIGSAQNSRIEENPDWVKPSADDGKHERYEFNGLEFKIDKESNLSITHIGRKKHIGGQPPQTENTEAVDSKVEFKGNGDFFVDIDDANLKLSLLKADKKAEFSLGDGLRIVWDGANDKYELVTNGGSVFTLDGPTDKFSWVASGGTKIEGDGSADKISAVCSNGDKIDVSAADGIQGETPSGTKLSMKSGAVEVEGTAAKLKLASGKVAMGSGVAGVTGPAEIMEQFDQLLTQLDLLLAGMISHKHIGNLGYPTGPTDAPETATYASVKAQIVLIKTSIGTFKGTV